MGKPGIHDLPRYVTGCGAMVLSLYFLIVFRGDFPVVAASTFFFLACAVDTHWAKIPNLLNLTLAVTGLAYHAFHPSGIGVTASLYGLALGFGLLLLPYLMGGMGAGDVKALAALGALTGPQALLHIFIYMALYGGVMAVLHYLFNADLKQRSFEWWVSVKASVLARDPQQLKPSKKEPLRFPYAAAIAFGYFSFIAWGGVL